MAETINKKENKLICSFCGSTEKDVNFLIEGESAFICDICIEKANEIVIEKLQALSNKDKKIYCNFLDQCNTHTAPIPMPPPTIISRG